MTVVDPFISNVPSKNLSLPLPLR